MKSVHPRRSCNLFFWLCSLLLSLVALPTAAAAQHSTPPAPRHSNAVATASELDATIPALFVSDIHFDPFHDPARVRQLVAAPVSQWGSILSRPPSPNQPQAFTTLQQTCFARGIDTPDPLLRSSLRAMRARQPDAKFMLVSGDLIAHDFTCRYKTLFPHATPAEYQSFVEKTIRYVVGQLRAAFPRIPIYVALGNNDSGCGDYRLDPGNDFLADTARIVATGLPASDRADRDPELLAKRQLQPHHGSAHAEHAPHRPR